MQDEISDTHTYMYYCASWHNNGLGKHIICLSKSHKNLFFIEFIMLSWKDLDFSIVIRKIMDMSLWFQCCELCSDPGAGDKNDYEEEDGAKKPVLRSVWGLIPEWACVFHYNIRLWASRWGQLLPMNTLRENVPSKILNSLNFAWPLCKKINTDSMSQWCLRLTSLYNQDSNSGM